MMHARLRQLVRATFFACAAVVLFAALAPRTEQVPLTGWDKANHVVAFAVLAVQAGLGWPGRLGIACMALVAYGGGIEILQSLTSTRTADWLDLLADAAGVLAGAGLLLAVQRWARTRT